MASKKTSAHDTMKKGSKPKPAPSGKAVAKAKAKAKVAPRAKAKSKAKTAVKAKAAPKAKTAKTAAKAAAAAPKAKAMKHGNPIMHWEIQSTQPEALHDFYSEVFGWSIDANNPMSYGMVSSRGLAGGIDGGIGGTEHSSGRVLVYASVQSIVPILKRIEERGGKTLMPRTDIGPVVMAIYTDPEGNAMGLIEDR
jgi:uncharacterized protein